MSFERIAYGVKFVIHAILAYLLVWWMMGFLILATAWAVGQGVKAFCSLVGC